MAEALGLLMLRSCLPTPDGHPIHGPHPCWGSQKQVEMGRLVDSEVLKNEARKRCANGVQTP